MLAGHVAEAVTILGPVAVEVNGAVVAALEDEPAPGWRVHVAPDGHRAGGGGGLDVIHPALPVSTLEHRRTICTDANQCHRT